MSSYIIQTGRKQSGRKARLIIREGRKFARPQAPGRAQIKKILISPQARKPRIRRVAGRKPRPLPLYPLTPKFPCKERGGGVGAINQYTLNQIGEVWFKCLSSWLDDTSMLAYNRGSLSEHRH